MAGKPVSWIPKSGVERKRLIENTAFSNIGGQDFCQRSQHLWLVAGQWSGQFDIYLITYTEKQ
jgi:hypothetical protein